MKRPRTGLPALTVTETAARAVRRGHPWVYREGLQRLPPTFAPGDLARLDDPAGEPLALCFVDPASPLVARVLSQDPARPEGPLVQQRLAAAIAARAHLLRSQQTTAYRLCNGEGDGLPGIVLDRYGDACVLRTDGEGARAFAERHRRHIEEALVAAGVTSLALRERGGQGEMQWALGRAPDEVVVREHGMAMLVDLLSGQKTGAFLDQRENRRLVRELSGGLRVLNLFSYAGGFSLAAALGGATQVTSVDIAAGAHRTAQRSFAENGLPTQPHRFVTADVFHYLDGALARKERFDLVICDPPSFAPSEKAKPKAMAAYRKLHRACASVLAPGAMLCAASCSSHVGEGDFLSTLEGLPLSLQLMQGQPFDHPTTPAWIEGRYLKFALLRDAR